MTVERPDDEREREDGELEDRTGARVERPGDGLSDGAGNSTGFKPIMLVAWIPPLLAGLGRRFQAIDWAGLASLVRRTRSTSGGRDGRVEQLTRPERPERVATPRPARSSSVTSKDMTSRRPFDIKKDWWKIAAAVLGIVLVLFLITRLLGGLMGGGSAQPAPTMPPQLTPGPTAPALVVAQAGPTGYFASYPPGAPEDVVFDLVLTVQDGNPVRLRGSDGFTATLELDPANALLLVDTAKGRTNGFPEGATVEISGTNQIQVQLAPTNYENQRRMRLSREGGLEIRLEVGESVGIVVQRLDSAGQPLANSPETYVVISNLGDQADGKSVGYSLLRSGVSDAGAFDPTKEGLYIRTTSQLPPDTVAFGTKREGSVLVIYVPGKADAPFIPPTPTAAAAPAATTVPSP